VRRARGATLVEIVVAIVIVATAAAAVLAALASASGRSANALLEVQAIAIAESYLEEIELRPFSNPTPGQTPTSRSLYNDIAEYNGLVDNGATDQTGSPVPGLSGYTVSVSETPTSGLTGITSANAVRIDVTVAYGPFQSVTVSGMRTNYW
jgi:MSHA pilin protein MshD